MKTVHIFLILIISVIIGSCTGIISVMIMSEEATKKIDEIKAEQEALKVETKELQRSSDKLFFDILEFSKRQGMFDNDVLILDDGTREYAVYDYYLIQLPTGEWWQVDYGGITRGCLVGVYNGEIVCNLPDKWITEPCKSNGTFSTEVKDSDFICINGGWYFYSSGWFPSKGHVTYYSSHFEDALQNIGSVNK